jgi:hypothetical protein
MSKRDRPPSYKVWVCKDDCGDRYESPIPLTAYAHFCFKKGGEHRDSIPEITDCASDKKRVASSSEQSTREETTMATKRAEPAEKAATQSKATKATKATKDTSEKQGRRSFGARGWLAVEVDKFLRKQKGDEPVSVGEIVKSVKNSAGEHPSTVAVAACITRWNEQGYVKVTKSRPLSFTGFAAKWKDSSLQEFLDAEKAKRAKARAAAKAA